MENFAFQTVAPTEAEFPIWLFVIAITTIALLFAGFVFWLIMRQVGKSRELSHLQQMKALELGQATEPSEAEKRQSKYVHNVFWISFWIGAAVPIAATSAAGSVIIQINLQQFSIILSIWICVAIISVASVVCATVLMISSRQSSPKAAKHFSQNGGAVKRESLTDTCQAKEPETHDH